MKKLTNSQRKIFIKSMIFQEEWEKKRKEKDGELPEDGESGGRRTN